MAKRQDRSNAPESDIKEKLVSLNRVTKVNKGGRTLVSQQ